MPTQAEDLRAVLDKTPLFSYLDESILSGLISKFEIVSYRLGDTIIREGDPGDSFYVIFNGRARVLGVGADGGELTLITLSRGDFFGERALVKGEPRSATIRAATDIVLAKLSKEYFLAAVENDPKAIKFLDNYIEHESLHNFLRQFTILSSLNVKETKVWIDEMEPEYFDAGEYVFRHGDEPEKFYVVLEGKVDVIKEGEGGGNSLTTIRAGEFFGELALLTKRPRAASIRASEPLKVLSLSKEKFEDLVHKSSSLQKKLSNTIALYNLDSLPESLPLDVKKSTSPPPGPESSKVQASSAGTAELCPARRSMPARVLGKFLKRVRYPWLEQFDVSDCGAACLAMICRYYGKKISVTRLRDMANISQQGATLLSVAAAGDSLGFKTNALNTDYEEMMRLEGPAIIHWEGNHYVVLYEADEAEVIVADPGIGLIEMSRKEFEAGWTGFALALQPAEHLSRVEESRGSLRRFLRYLFQERALLAGVLGVSILIGALGLALPLFVHLVVDRVIAGRDVSLLRTMFTGMVGLTVFGVFVSSFRGYLMTLISNRFEKTSLSLLYRHILSAPMRFFNVRKLGDILVRFEENENLKNMLERRSFSILIDAVMVVLSLALMFFYSPLLTLIVVMFIPLFGGVSVGFSPLLRSMNRRQFAADAASDSFLVESIGGVSTLKAAGAEGANRSRWEKLYARVLEVRFKNSMAGISVESASRLLESFSGLILLYFGSLQVVEGNMTLGALMAFYILANNVNEPIRKLVEMWERVQESLESAQRISDIYNVPPEEELAEGRKPYLPAIKGHIRMENVTFSYAAPGEPALRNVSLDIQPGQKIAIVGRSGSGKTTLVNMLLRFYSPQEGRV
ncbi:MAG: peptidase domain-containing ABC transporter, partial [Nitrospinaceae bacterium]|nr:peptidase domain-containing ABC transporter [Nitrospinaceae bacterium]